VGAALRLLVPLDPRDVVGDGDLVLLAGRAADEGDRGVGPDPEGPRVGLHLDRVRGAVRGRTPLRVKLPALAVPDGRAREAPEAVEGASFGVEGDGRWVDGDDRDLAPCGRRDPVVRVRGHVAERRALKGVA